MPHILVTGASGFLGGRTAAHFAGVPNFSVRATSRSSKKAGALTQLGCEFVAGDLTDAHFVSNLVEGIDTIVHCAASVSYPPLTLPTILLVSLAARERRM